jgi:hypothetical protein
MGWIAMSVIFCAVSIQLPSQMKGPSQVSLSDINLLSLQKFTIQEPPSRGRPTAGYGKADDAEALFGRRGTRGRFVSRMISGRDFRLWGNLFLLKTACTDVSMIGGCFSLGFQKVPDKVHDNFFDRR